MKISNFCVDFLLNFVKWNFVCKLFVVFFERIRAIFIVTMFSKKWKQAILEFYQQISQRNQFEILRTASIRFQSNKKFFRTRTNYFSNSNSNKNLDTVVCKNYYRILTLKNTQIRSQYIIFYANMNFTKLLKHQQVEWENSLQCLNKNNDKFFHTKEHKRQFSATDQQLWYKDLI